MFIEVVIEGEIINRIHVNADLPVTGFNKKECKRRQNLIEDYLHELKSLYPQASFQLAYESRIHLIEIND